MNRRFLAIAAVAIWTGTLSAPVATRAQDAGGDPPPAPSEDPPAPPEEPVPPPDPVPPPPAPPAGDPPPDLRFFPKELEDALKALQDPAAEEEEIFEAMAKIARMRGLEGATEPLKKDAFGPLLQKALDTRQDTFADMAGNFLASLDKDRLEDDLRKAINGERDRYRLRNMTFLAENLGAPVGVGLLAGPLATSTVKEVRLRVVEALGLLRATEGITLAEGMMNDPDPESRNVAAMALGHIGSNRAVAALLSDLAETKGNTGWYCAEALGLIEDPAIFEAVVARAGTGGGIGPRAKALENCARLPHVDALTGMVRTGSSTEVRVAAANALGRIVGELPAGSDALKAEKREAVAEALFEGIASDPEPSVRAACLWALRRCATEKTGSQAFKRVMNIQGDDKVLYFFTLMGERKVAEAGPMLLRLGILGSKQPMIRRASGVAFWQVADAAVVKEFKEKILGAGDFNTLDRLCEALGSWRSKEGFETAVQLLRTTRTGSREQFAVMLALEKMTGHYFDPSPGTWNKWFSKNQEFFSHKQEKLERDKWRAEFDKENKGFRQSKETEKSVQMGLSWLARHQGFDGIWDCTGFLNRCDPKSPCPKSGGGRTQFSQAGTTGLPCLTFTGAGYSPAAGRFRHSLYRGLEALMATMTVEGDYDQADYIWACSYARPIAMQALSEAFAATGDDRYRRAAERILCREFAIMNERGGWRYARARERPEVDSSVSAWVVFAIKAAEKAGLPVPRLLWEGPYMAFDILTERVPQAGPFEELIQEAGDYGTEVGKGKEKYLFQSGYTDAKGGPSRATTPIGLMSRIFLGWRRTHPFCIGSANYIVKNYLPSFDVFGEPGKEDWSKAGRFTPKSDWTMYNYYYCTLSMHQMGGKYFYDWNRRISRVMPFFQKKEGCERGSWPGWNVDGQDGWLYTTSMGILTMETYYRYAPILAD